jgi:hypothetical protein
MNSLPRAELLFRVSVLAVFLFSATSCLDDRGPSSSQATVNFTQSTLRIVENGGAQNVSLTLDMPALADGEIVLTTSTTAPMCFTTDPARQSNEIKVPVKKGQSALDFKITPVDNSALDGSRTITITISSISEGMRAGVDHDLVVVVNDDEVPVNANFALNSINLRENDTAPARIEMIFAAPAPADGVIVLQLQSTSGYDQEYSTQPAAVASKMFVQVARGATSAAVDLYAVNDVQFKADRNITFTIIGATGGVSIGARDSFRCTISEDDGQQISPISMIRALYNDASFVINKDLYIEGTVTSGDNTSPSRIVVEDATGAIQIGLNTINTLRRGDVVLVNLNFGLVHIAQDVLEVSQIADFQKLSEETVQANKMSIGELLATGNHLQSQTVQIPGAFAGADGAITFAGDRVLSDGVNTITVRTNAFADFGDQVIPKGLVSVTGIVINVRGQYFLYPQQREDVRKQQFMPIRPW